MYYGDSIVAAFDNSYDTHVSVMPYYIYIFIHQNGSIKRKKEKKYVHTKNIQ